MSETINFTIENLGKCPVASPIRLSKNKSDDYLAGYVNDQQCLLYAIDTNRDELGKVPSQQEVLEKAGPREKIYFDPSKVRAGILTCGGLCPGLNDVVRSVVLTLWYQYGVKRVDGLRYGYRGLIPDYGLPTLELNPEVVSEIHRRGGTVLGSSRGGGDRVGDMVDTIERMNLNMLFVIGGDGTQKGALEIHKEAQKRGYRLAVVGVPKTIDNDLSFVERSFGFETAVAEAVRVVSGAHVEAHDAINGVALVKLMGRQSGFIAAHTALAMPDVNFICIPEVPFTLNGENGLFIHLKKRLQLRNHAVVVVAEGAGQNLLDAQNATDASGNKKLADIGLYVRDAMSVWFKEHKMELNLKYIDPSYIIRSAPASPTDALYCTRLGTHAVHAAMAGKTGLLISLVNNHFVHVPIAMAVSKRNFVDPEGSLWRDVLKATGQPELMR